MDERLNRLLELLDAADAEAVGTSMRIPVALRDAAALAAEMGLTSSATEVAVRGMRDRLEALAQQAVLDAHYAQYPWTRPSLAELALATAALDGHPLADRADLIERASAEIFGVVDRPTPDDVLVFAAALASVERVA